MKCDYCQVRKPIMHLFILLCAQTSSDFQVKTIDCAQASCSQKLKMYLLFRHIFAGNNKLFIQLL